MCRYCACNLSKEELSKACRYKKSNHEEYQNTPWIEVVNDRINYEPSNLLEPGKCNGLPVISSGYHFNVEDSRVLSAMHWTLVPSWFKPKIDTWSLSTFNARVESLVSSRVFNESLSQGRRCIIMMEGFYEIKKKTAREEIFYLHSNNGKLLMAAGLFSFGESNFPTCTMITTDANKHLKKIHNRIPLLLSDDADLEAWLDYKNISSQEALAIIKGKSHQEVTYYQVKEIGSKIALKNRTNAGSKDIMAKWLNQSTK